MSRPASSPRSPRRSFDEPLRREQGRRNGGVDVDDGHGGAGLQHRVESGLSASAPSVAHRGGNAYHRGWNEPGDDRGQGPFPSCEDEVDFRTTRFGPPNGRKEPVEPRDAHVVRSDDANPQRQKDSPCFLGERHVAGARGEDGDDAASISSAERARDPNQTAVGQESHPGMRPRGGLPGSEGATLGRGRPGNERSEVPFGEGFHDLEKVVDALSFPKNDLGYSRPTRPFPVQPSKVLDPKRPWL